MKYVLWSVGEAVVINGRELNTYIFLVGLGEAFDCLRRCKECAKVSSVAEKAVNLTDTEEVTIQIALKEHCSHNDDKV